MGGVRTVVLLVRLVGLAYRRQFGAVEVHRVLVKIQLGGLGGFVIFPEKSSDFRGQ